MRRVAQSEFRKILRFRVVAEKVHSAQPKRFTRRARNPASLTWGGGVVAELSTKKYVDSSKNRFFCVEYRNHESAMGGGVVAEPSKTKSVDSGINNFFVLE